MLNRLVSAQAGGQTYTYTYDHTGLRVSKSATGVYEKYINHNQSVVLVLNSSNTVVAKYFRGTELISELLNGTYYLYNSHGDVVQLIASDGTITRDYEYDAFGIEKDKQALDTNPFRYCGEFFDKETGLIYLRARYYDPEIGRFISEDTHWAIANMIYGDNPDENNFQPNVLAIIQSANLYAYCMNNPILYNDFNGNVAAVAIFAGIGTAICPGAGTIIGVVVGVVVTAAVGAIAGKALGDYISEKRDTKQSGKGDNKAKDGDTTGKPNTSKDLKDKKGNVIGKRYYGPDGRAVKDVDYTDHGNPKTHPKVPHEHKWDWSDPKNPVRSK